MRSQIKMHPERSQPEAICDILAEGYLAHISYQEDGQPYVIPMSYHYDLSQPQTLYLHGSPKSHTLLALSRGIKVCVEVTQLDALIYSRTGLHHSMNYRSVVAFGQGKTIEDLALKRQVLEDMLSRYYPGRKINLDYDPLPDSHLDNTLVIGIQFSQSSAKVRATGANGPGDQAYFQPGNAGLVPLQTTASDWRPYTQQNPPFYLSTDKALLDQTAIYELLKDAYWCQGITPENLTKRIAHSLCYGLYQIDLQQQKKQIGFARLITDHASFGYLADVIIHPQFRGQGLGKWLMAGIMAHPVVKDIRWCLLSTKDAHELYAKYGFQAPPIPEKLMLYLNPDIYTAVAA